MKALIQRELQEGILTQQKVLAQCVESIAEIGGVLAKALAEGHKILICGNGGSAADAQHIAAELVGRFHRERKALPAVALTTDTSILTCIGNDYGFDQIFSRQVQALGQRGDVLIGITTSGLSPNVLNALQAAKDQGLVTVLLTGKDGGPCKKLAQWSVVVPSQCTPHIQQGHIAIGHILCLLIEQALFGKATS